MADGRILIQPPQPAPPPMFNAPGAAAAPPLYGTQPTGEHYARDPAYGAPLEQLQSIGTGLMRGVHDIMTIPSTISQWIVRPFAPEGGRDVMDQATEMDRRSVEQNLHQPEPGMSTALANISEFVPGAAIFGPGSGWGNVFKYGVVPGMASEAAGALTEGTPLEPYARVAGALLAGVGMGLQQGAGTAAGIRSTANAGPAMQVIARYLRGLNLTEAEISAAEQLIRRGAQGPTQGGQPINITWPEALAQVTNGRVDMAALQRVVEQSRSGAAPMTEYLAGRPAATQAAMGAELRGAGMNPTTPPSRLGTLIQDLARNEIESIRSQINAGTSAEYFAAQKDIIPASRLAQLRQSPIFRYAVEQVRRDPVYQEKVGSLPDDNVVFLDAVKQWLTENASISGGQLADVSQAAYGRTADVVREAATDYSPSLRSALQTQAYQRQNWLGPVEAGPLGDVMGTPDLNQQIRKMFPSAPSVGRSGETAQAIDALRYANPDAARNFVGQYLQQAFNEAAQARTTGPNQFGAAGFVANIRGNAEQARNLEAAVRALPNGDDVWRGLDNLFTLFEATGRRATAGSPTAFNQAIIEELSAGTPFGNVMASLGSPADTLSMVRRVYNDIRTGANTRELANVITDPNNAPLFRMLANHSAFDDLLAIGGVLLSHGIVGEQQTDYPPLLMRQ